MFAAELDAVTRDSGSSAVLEEVLALAELLRRFGPQLKRPHCDTLSGSKHANMKELRADTKDQVLRIALAFDPKRAAILLLGGNKSGVSQKRFYRQLLAKADALYDAHLTKLAAQKGEGEDEDGQVI